MDYSHNMSEEIEFLKLIVTRLDSAGIPYMLTGSTAMHFYSTPRMTRDIDLVIAVSPEKAEILTGLFSGDCYIDQQSVCRAIENEGMFNIIHNALILKADFIIRKNDEYRLKEFSRRKKVGVDGFEIQIVAVEDLILSKLVWGKSSNSDFQLRDVRNLLSDASGIDWEYLSSWARVLDVSEAMNKAKKDA